MDWERSEGITQVIFVLLCIGLLAFFVAIAGLLARDDEPARRGLPPTGDRHELERYASGLSRCSCGEEFWDADAAKRHGEREARSSHSREASAPAQLVEVESQPLPGPLETRIPT
jgi:hypothetical protein